MTNTSNTLGYTLADAVYRTGDPPRLILNVPYERPIPDSLDDLAELIDDLLEDGRRAQDEQWPQNLAGQLAWQRSRVRAVESVAPLLDDIVEQLNAFGYFITVRTNCEGPSSTHIRVEPL